MDAEKPLTVVVIGRTETGRERRSGGADEGLGRYARSFGWLVAARLGRMVLSITVGAWVARYLAPAEFGALSYQLSLVAMVSALAGAGLDGLLVRELVTRPGGVGETLGTAMGLRLAAGVVLYVALLAGWWATHDGGAGGWMLAVLGADIILQSANVFDLYFQAQVANKWTALAGIGAAVAASAVRVGLILAGASLVCFAGAVLVESLVLAAGLAYFYGRGRPTTDRWSYDAGYARRLLAESWPLIVSAGAVAGCMRVDQVMLGALAGEAAVGVYAAAARLGEAWYFVPMFMGTVLNRWVLDGRALGDAVYRERLLRFYAGTVWCAIGIAAAVALLASPLVLALYGRDYAAAAGALRIHAIGGVFLALGVAAGKWFVAEGHTRGLMGKALLGLGVNVAANALLIPAYGVNGAAAGTAAGHLAANVLYDFIDPRVRTQRGLKLRAFTPWSLRRS